MLLKSLKPLLKSLRGLLLSDTIYCDLFQNATISVAFCKTPQNTYEAFSNWPLNYVVHSVMCGDLPNDHKNCKCFAFFCNLTPKNVAFAKHNNFEKYTWLTNACMTDKSIFGTGSSIASNNCRYTCSLWLKHEIERCKLWWCTCPTWGPVTCWG
jgi:hypothetical protein